jgi:hypothetical protein
MIPAKVAVGRQPPEIVEQRRDCAPNRSCRARHVGKFGGNRLEGWCYGDGQAIGQADPDQAKARDCITGTFDLGGIAGTDRHTEIADVLRRFAQSGGIDAQESQCRFVTEEIGGHGSALGFWHKLVQSLLNGYDALVERQSLQLRRCQVQPLQGFYG